MTRSRASSAAAVPAAAPATTPAPKGKAAAAAAAKAAKAAAAAEATPATSAASSPHPLDSANVSDRSSASSPAPDDGNMQTAAEATAAAASSLALAAAAQPPSHMSPPTATTPLVVLPGASLPMPTGMQHSAIMQQHRQAGVGGGFGVSPPVHVSRYQTAPGGHSVVPLPPFVSASGAPLTASPPPFARHISLSRIPSQNGTGGGGGAGGAPVPGGLGAGSLLSSEWRAGVSVEERMSNRRRVREAYFRRCPTYAELIETATAIEEELLFACSANRLDYFKAAIDWDARIQIKRQQLTQQQAPGGVGRSVTLTPGTIAPSAASATSAAAAGVDDGAAGLAGRKRTMDEFGGNLSASSTSLLVNGNFVSDLAPAPTHTAAEATPVPTSTAPAAAAASKPLPSVSSLFPSASLPKDLFPTKPEPLPTDAPPAKKQRN